MYWTRKRLVTLLLLCQVACICISLTEAFELELDLVAIKNEQSVASSSYPDHSYSYEIDYLNHEESETDKDRLNKVLNTTTDQAGLNQEHLNLCSDSSVKCILAAIFLGLVITCSIIGNMFVIAAIYLEKSLQSVANYLIVSLACADLMVAIMVMPVAAYNEISYKWNLGPIICDIWTSFDVLCCTASIFHLVAIALDRYWAITNPRYGAKRTAKRIVTMIVIIWVVSTCMAVSPHLFGLGSASQIDTCQLTNNLTYQLISTFLAFYLPLIFMCIIYWKIFQSAKFRIRKKAFNNHKTGDKSIAAKDKAKKNDSTRKSTPQVYKDEEKEQLNNEFSASVSAGRSEQLDSNLCGLGKLINILMSLRKRRRKYEATNKSEEDSDSKVVSDSPPSSDDIKVSLPTTECNTMKELVPLKASDLNAQKMVQSNADLMCQMPSIQFNQVARMNIVSEEASVNAEKSLLELAPEERTTSFQANIQSFSVGKQSYPTSKVDIHIIRRKQAKIDMKRERKATKTLGIIMGCFIICWLPFFSMQLFFSVCKQCTYTTYLSGTPLVTILLWLGYLNSLLNPLIYTVFSPDFRTAFSKILFGKYTRKRYYR